MRLSAQWNLTEPRGYADCLSALECVSATSRWVVRCESYDDAKRHESARAGISRTTFNMYNTYDLPPQVSVVARLRP